MTAKKNHEKNQNVKGLTYGFQQGVLALKSDYHPDGINLMMQEPSEGNSPKSSFMRHGLLGHYSEKTNDTRLPDQDKALSEALQTRMEVSSLVSGDYELASTGSILDLPGGGCITFSGRPYFRNSVLTDIANKNGPVAAIAHAYDSYSQDVFRHIYGAFCCAIIDNQAQRVLLGIDRLGQHSLYYDDGDDTLAFGSSASEALTWSNPDRGNTLHNQGIYNYLYFHMVPCPVSVYRGLKKLPAAHYIDFHDGQCDLVNYWLPDFSESTSAQSFETLSGQLMDVLRSAVQQSINGAGKVGCFLSGGLDSSTVTGVLADIREQQTEAYSIGFSAEGYDEMAFARITANHFGVDLKEYYVTPQDVVDTLPAIAGSYDEPFGNSSALPAYFCARMAADNGIDTLLAGDGGDEIFAGNERYIRQKIFERYSKVPAPLRKGLIEPLARILPSSLPLVAKAGSYIAQANTPLPDRLQSYNFLHRHPVNDIFTEDFLGEVDTEYPLDLQRSIYRRPPDASDLNRMLYLDWQNTLADNDLRKVSHMCALAGVDVTYPMLDDALVEFSCRVPSEWKISNGDLRYFFKRSLQRWLPAETISKNKQGFGLPFGVWMQTYQPLREMAYDNLLKLKNREFIRAEFIDKAIEMHQSEHAAYYGELVWIFTVFELWMESRN